MTSLRLRDACFAYPGGPEVLRGVDLTLAPGELVGVIGPNGAGKSTLLALLAGWARTTAGEASLEGRPLHAWGRRPLARRLAVVPQRPQLPTGFRVDTVVMMGRAPHLGFLAGERPQDRAVVAAALRRTGLWGKRHQLVDALSGGERQRVVLARALAQEPRFLLLDEPTQHLDLRHQSELMRHVERLASQDGLGVLVVLHDLNLAARCGRVVLLAGGRVAAEGTAGQVLREPLLERAYETPVTVLAGERPVVLAH